MNSKRRFSKYTQKRLEEAGWFPGRNILGEIKFPEDIELFPAALKIIAEFGNLQIGKEQSGQTGINIAKSPVWIDPMEAYFEEDFKFAQEIIEESIFPIGLIDFDNSAIGYLYVNKNGAVFCIDVFEWFFDEDFDRALEMMLEGIKATPLKNPTW